MIYLIFCILLVLSLVYLFLPLVQGAAPAQEKAVETKGLEDLDVLRQNWADIENDYRLGKISIEDYERLKKEILGEWQKLRQNIHEERNTY
ncbi:MAG: hypothetical protein NZM25_00935 [Leptospiraceae bacterium]|nr:hypothetical protein [Leptospiraceae bacterium]MDW8306288.1 hypothetical protein [Leptospiraceae bacterium]